jgi:hypothetical protein
MSSFENFVVSNLGVRKPLIFDSVPPSSSLRAAGVKGSQFLDITTNQLYEKTGHNNDTDWVYLRNLGEGGSANDDTFIQFSGETLANFIALNDDVFDINSELGTLNTSVRSVVGGGISAGGEDLSLYTLSTDFTALSGQFLGALTQFTTTVDTQISDLTDRIQSYPSLSVGEDAPASPIEGDLWWESDSGRLKIYYNDGDNNYWVDASPISNYGSSSGGTDSSGAPTNLSYSLNQLTDVTISSPSSGQTIQYNGSYWENGTSTFPGNFTAYNFSKRLRTDGAAFNVADQQFMQDFSGSAVRRLEVELTTSPGYSRAYIEIHTNCFNSSNLNSTSVFLLQRKVGQSSSTWTDIDYLIFPPSPTGEFTFRTFIDDHNQVPNSVLIYRLQNVTGSGQTVTQVFSTGGHTFTIRECN